MSEEHKPYIPASTILPEITLKGVLLGVLLSVVLAGANAYLGLFAGMTVSASIPAAVISMAILKLFKRSNILENNAVQTAASAGESLAAGVIFTFPALILMGYWTEFNYLETVAIALCGGVLGVLFTIPLRSALIVKEKLTFPEGIATSEVLKSGEEHDGGKSIRALLYAALIGGGIKLVEAGLKLWGGSFEKAALIKSKLYAYFGMNLSPALIAVGYIVGLRIASLVFIGGVITWWIAIPIYIAMNGGDPSLSAEALGGQIWTSKMRFLGVGAMIVGGLWALISLTGSLKIALGEALGAFKSKAGDAVAKIRTEYDTPMSWVMIGIGALVVPIFIIYLKEIEHVPISVFMALFMVIAGFLFSAVAGYMAGLVGSSNNPISGVTIATILTSALILLALLGTGSAKGPAAAIMIGAVVCCAAAIAGDNMQDLKAGHLLGATPWRQQIMQFVGVIAAALTIPFVLNALNEANGFGPATEANPDALAAPQATLMQSVAEGVFGGNLPWGIISIGAIIGVLIILADLYQKRRGSEFRIPVLAVAVGLYLPFELDSAIMVGGVIAWLVTKFQNRKTTNSNFKDAQFQSNKRGLLFASGLITGEALMGILIAIYILNVKRGNIPEFLNLGVSGLNFIGVIVILIVCYLLYNAARKAFNNNLK